MDQNVTPQLTRLQEPWESPGWRCCNHAQKSTPCRWTRVLWPNASTASGSALVQFWMKVYLADKCQNLRTLDKYGYNTESYTHNMNYLIAKTGLTITIKKNLGLEFLYTVCRICYVGRILQAAPDLAAARSLSIVAAYEAL